MITKNAKSCIHNNYIFCVSNVVYLLHVTYVNIWNEDTKYLNIIAAAAVVPVM